LNYKKEMLYVHAKAKTIAKLNGKRHASVVSRKIIIPIQHRVSIVGRFCGYIVGVIVVVIAEIEKNYVKTT
jgi:hypothetical protein